MSADDLRREYLRRRDAALVPIAERLQRLLADELANTPRIDRIGARAKGVERFMDKAGKTLPSGAAKYSDPLHELQDQIGARIVVFYLGDVEAVRRVIEQYHRFIEAKDLIPDSPNEFGYVGKHYILALPADVVPDALDADLVPKFFELQIKTLFQHAWSEASHDLAYKPDVALSIEQRREVAFTAAQAWGADQLFERLHGQLGSSAA